MAIAWSIGASINSTFGEFLEPNFLLSEVGESSSYFRDTISGYGPSIYNLTLGFDLQSLVYT